MSQFSKPTRPSSDFPATHLIADFLETHADEYDAAIVILKNRRGGYRYGALKSRRVNFRLRTEWASQGMLSLQALLHAVFLFLFDPNP